MVASNAQNPAQLHTLAHKQAMDLFHATKAKIVERALSSQESVRLLGDPNIAMRAHAN